MLRMLRTCLNQFLAVAVLLDIFVTVRGSHAQDSPPAQQLLLQVIEADKQNRERMVNYLFRETVELRYVCAPGVHAPSEAKTYEVILIEGEPYFQLVEENGRPISAKKSREEESKMRKVADQRRASRLARKTLPTQTGRTAYRYEHLADFHAARHGGTELRNDRALVVLETEPVPGVAARTEEELILVNSRTKLWVDAQTRIPVKGEVRIIKEGAKWPRGMVLEAESELLDGGWIPRRLYTRRPLTGPASRLAKCDSVEVEQSLSKFRKFEAESKFYPGDMVPEN